MPVTNESVNTQIVAAAGNILEFTKSNDALIQKLLSQGLPEDMVRPRTFGEFIALGERDIEAYNFFNAKQKCTDEEVTDMTSYVASFIVHTTDPSGTAKLIDYVVDFLCHSFHNATVHG